MIHHLLVIEISLILLLTIVRHIVQIHFINICLTILNFLSSRVILLLQHQLIIHLNLFIRSHHMLWGISWLSHLMINDALWVMVVIWIHRVTHWIVSSYLVAVCLVCEVLWLWDSIVWDLPLHALSSSALAFSLTRCLLITCHILCCISFEKVHLRCWWLSIFEIDQILWCINVMRVVAVQLIFSHDVMALSNFAALLCFPIITVIIVWILINWRFRHVPVVSRRLLCVDSWSWHTRYISTDGSVCCLMKASGVI